MLEYLEHHLFAEKSLSEIRDPNTERRALKVYYWTLCYWKLCYWTP